MVKEIYLAGGCFWGIEQYLENVQGIVETEVGYANGSINHPTYEEVCRGNTGHAETVKAAFDDEVISLPFILELYYDVINPTSRNRQGGDVGTQYRTGIYYVEESHRAVIEASLAKLQEKYSEPIVVEVERLRSYSRAEEYHQKYLDKNPRGYCHIGADKMEKARQAADTKRCYGLKTREELKESLTPLQFDVTQNNGTEPPFQNAYHSHFQKGIYVDITTGEPLFTSTDKFQSGCGRPAFAKPIDQTLVDEITDRTHGMYRTEVRSKLGNAHLGHVFLDGPKELGGRRYCINSAALRFVPLEDMEQEGYGLLLQLLR